jgi:hypothetical protein
VRLRQDGITHVVHNFVQARFRGLRWYAGPAWTPREIGTAREFLARFAEIARAPDAVDWRMGGYLVWALRDRPAARPAPVWFVPGTESRARAAFARLDAGDPAGAMAEADRRLAPLRGVFEAEFIGGYLALRAERWAEARRRLAPGLAAGFVTDGNWSAFAEAAWRLGLRNEARAAARRAHALQPGPVPAAILEALGEPPERYHQ